MSLRDQDDEACMVLDSYREQSLQDESSMMARPSHSKVNLSRFVMHS